ncbi:MAG: peptidoglycan DD-metalloendopeptidase family protein [Firmicutes bacterium]|nr:peptidoglycan DD-metalloendopeptidase family protein [Bacillota bacterium]
MDVLWRVAETVWSMSGSLSLLIGAVLVARGVWIHRLPKRTFSLLWTICAFRALLPAVPRSSVNIGSLLSKNQIRTFAGNASLFGEVLDVVPEGMGAIESGSMITESSTPIGEILLWIWLFGVVASGVYFLTVYLSYRRIFAQSLPLNKKLIWESGLLRSIQLRTSDRISAPLSYGLVCPVILFPASMDWEDSEALRMILDHEAVHIRRFDGLLKKVLALSLCLHWWNPMVWCMFRFGNRDVELACDEAVVRKAGLGLRESYALALIRMEERRGTRGVLYSHFSENAIEERITAIMKIKKTSGLALVCALCLVVGLTMVFATEAPEVKEEGMIWPAEGCDRITMTFGERMHPVTGEVMMFDHITISDSEGNARGAAVMAAASGIVTEADYHSDLGYYLVIDHGNGLMTKYTHCEELLVQADQNVAQGDTIALVGATGKVTGHCLGFYVSQDGQAVDPMLYLGE